MARFNRHRDRHPDQHFETTALQANLNQRSLQSGLIVVAAQPIKLAIGIGGTMVLARLLVPADFGLLAMVQPVLSMVDSLSNLGLETATVQRQEFNPEQASAIFWLSLKITTWVIGGLVLSAHLVAQFYRNRLVRFRVLGLNSATNRSTAN